MVGYFLFECFLTQKQKIPTLYGVGIKKNVDGLRNKKSPPCMGWELKKM
jgi:hypothetical protein